MADDDSQTKTKARKHGVETSDAAIDGMRLKDAPGHLVRRAQQRHQEIYAREVGAGGPTSRQFAALLTICQRPGLTQTELVAATGIDRSTIGDMLDRLTAKGLIERKRISRDGRANALHATEAGLHLVTTALPGVRRTQERLLERLPQERHGEALEILRLIADLA